MSLCPHTLRAISRSRSPNPKTLLPFLYQTATIQQWKPAARPTTRRNISSRSSAPPRDDIPFADADGNLPPTVEEVQASRKTTITDTERAAFEKLYKTFKTQGQGRRKEDGEHEELDQMADEYYEDDEEGSSKSLDKVFEEALQGGTPRDRRGLTPRTKPLESPAPAKEVSSTEPATPQQRKRMAVKAEKDRMRKLRSEERDRVDNLLKTAQTDRELWAILNNEVLDPLRKLNLDAPIPPTKKEHPKPSTGSTKTRNKKPPTTPASFDTNILFPNYPQHLLTALTALRVNFPASPLPLTILPTIKSLGRSSYALGATSQLYKHLLRTAWLQQSSYSLIDTLMSDMEANIVEFDSGILEVLDGVVREHEAARQGKLGREIQMVMGLESWVEGIEKVKKWRGVVAEKVGVQIRDEGVRERERRVVRGARQEEGYTPVVEPVQRSGATRSARVDAIPFVGEEGQVLEDVDMETESGDGAMEDDGDARGEWAQEQERERRDAEDADMPAKVML
jgi:hypothetical protein